MFLMLCHVPAGMRMAKSSVAVARGVSWSLVGPVKISAVPDSIRRNWSFVE